MFFDEDSRNLRAGRNDRHPLMMTLLALLSCALMLTILVSPARAETVVPSNLLDSNSLADQRILMGFLMIAFAAMAAGSVSFWRRSFSDMIHAEELRRGR
ncbi:hypothetical protein J5J10_04560 [Ciceribacter sp. L1K23]|uniref:hypothetical protein n=1 Tax=Ciceribacter sp. L1K23 TaxID=2820276 RepID=UPI001B82B9D6|nr:hypothetical protein [Ciceribacter sp. L1K23]MBR0554946.1 hypothetical protein [Ciceribacter sp. L1K23]